jgi:porin
MGRLALITLITAATTPLQAQPNPSAPASAPPDEAAPTAPDARELEGPGTGVSLHDLLDLPGWVDVTTVLNAEPLGNAGGLGSSGAWIQQLTMGAAFGLGLAKAENQWTELDHWQLNTQLMLFSGRAGYGLAIGAAFPLQATDHPTGLWLTEASVERKGGLGPLAIKGGLLSLNPDFTDMPVFDLYVHSALDNTLNLTVFGLPTNPLVSPGAVVRLDLGQAGDLRFGAYWLNSQTQLAGLFGVDPLQPTVAGTTQAMQWNFVNLPGARQVEGPIRLGERWVERQLPQPRLMLGALNSSTSSAGRNRVVYGGLSLPVRLPFGLDHRLWTGVNVGLDPSRNSAPLFLSGGWAMQGLLPGRPHDVLALGLGRTSFGPDSGSDQSYEGVIELNYNVALNRSMSLGPVVQLIVNPDGSGAVPSIVAAGLQLELRF